MKIRLPAAVLAAVAALLLGSAPDASGGWGGNKRDKGKWEVWEECTLKESSANDGDSFYVFAPKFKTKAAQERKLRLYFCDTPENEPDLEERIEQQRKHWDLPDAATVLKLGREAENFTKRFLSRGFTVYTKREDALGRGKPRIAVMVMVNGEDLALTLVRNGYARVGGFKTDLSNVPGYGMSQAKFLKMLQEADFKAREERRGCWAESGKANSGPGRFVRSAATAPSGVRERATGYVHGDAQRAA
ncbi:MAG: thermonuclease family protein, partial [Kiritimatiellae bacterium]|nr:thermonuclease family protein [Kiritimatiellia bacterium]